MIIDTHTHVVNSDRINHPLHPDARGWSLEVSNNVEDLIIEMDNAGVTCATLVQPASTYGLDNSYQCDSANRFSPRTVAVGILNPAVADAAEKLSYWVNERGMSGVRLLTEAEPDDPACDPLWTRAEELQIPISVGGGGTSQKVERITIMAARHPKAIVAPDHFAGWSGSEDKLAMTIALENLATLSNAYLRVSSTSLGPYADLSSTDQELFQRVIRAFTPQRVMWGSNFPSSKDGGYIGQVELGKSALSWLNANEIDWIMGKTAAQIWPMLKG